MNFLMACVDYHSRTPLHKQTDSPSKSAMVLATAKTRTYPRLSLSEAELRPHPGVARQPRRGLAAVRQWRSNFYTFDIAPKFLPVHILNWCTPTTTRTRPPSTWTSPSSGRPVVGMESGVAVKDGQASATATATGSGTATRTPKLDMSGMFAKSWAATVDGAAGWCWLPSLPTPRHRAITLPPYITTPHL